MIRFPHPGSIDGFKSTLGGMLRQWTTYVRLKSFVPLPLGIQAVTSVYLIKWVRKINCLFVNAIYALALGPSDATEPNLTEHTHTYEATLWKLLIKIPQILIYKRKVNEFVNLVSLEKAFCSDRKKSGEDVRWRKTQIILNFVFRVIFAFCGHEL